MYISILTCTVYLLYQTLYNHIIGMYVHMYLHGNVVVVVVVVIMHCSFCYLQDGYTALHMAIFEGHQHVVELLLEEGCDVNHKAKVSVAV